MIGNNGLYLALETCQEGYFRPQGSGSGDCVCFEEGFVYKGAEHRVKTIPYGGYGDTREDCQERCAEHNDCEYWSWKIDGNCYLKSERGNIEKSERFVSGSKHCMTED